MNSAIKNVLCLTIITLVAGVGLGYVYDITKEPIAKMEEETQLKAYRTVFPDAADFHDAEGVPSVASSSEKGCDIDSVVVATDSAGSDIGYVVNVTSHEGYGGDISLSMGIDSSGKVLGVEILKISETAGLGMKAKEDRFKDQFKDKLVTQFTYTKTGATSDFEIDAISGATITTKAVTNAVNTGLECFAAMGGAGI